MVKRQMLFQYKNIREIIEAKKENLALQILDPDYIPNHDRNLVIRLVSYLIEDMVMEQMPLGEEAPTLSDYANKPRASLDNSLFLRSVFNSIGFLTLSSGGVGHFRVGDKPVKLEDQPPLVRFLNRVQTYTFTYFMIMKWLVNDPDAKKSVQKSAFSVLMRSLFGYYLAKFSGDRFSKVEKKRIYTLFYHYLSITPVQNLMNYRFEYWMDLDPIIQMAQYTFTDEKEKFIADLGVRDVFEDDNLDDSPQILKLLSVNEFWKKFSKESFSIDENAWDDPLLVPAQKNIIKHLLKAPLPGSLENLANYMKKTRNMKVPIVKTLFNSLYKLEVLKMVENI
jgi:hypothetical protein